MKIIVITPTYNESENIEELLDTLCGRVFKEIPEHKMGALIVDGNSPDGTAEIVQRNLSLYPNLHLLVEQEKQGIGAAYVMGINYAIKKLGADAVIEFDGDFQHDPDDIKRLVAEFDKGYDFVIGSRYVPGGSIPPEWAFYRKFLSRAGGFAAKIILGLPTHDNTSGFRLYRVKNFAEKLPLGENEVLSKYYAYKIHFLNEMLNMKAKTKEIPIHFMERQGGSSKNTLRDIFDSLYVVFALRFRKK